MVKLFIHEIEVEYGAELFFNVENEPRFYSIVCLNGEAWISDEQTSDEHESIRYL